MDSLQIILPLDSNEYEIPLFFKALYSFGAGGSNRLWKTVINRFVAKLLSCLGGVGHNKWKRVNF